MSVQVHSAERAFCPLLVLTAAGGALQVLPALVIFRQADQILVLDGGRLLDRGTHEDLLARGGLYAHLHATQFVA